MSGAGEWLPRLALARPVTLLMVALAVVVVGVIAWLEIPRQLLPSGFTPPLLYVHVPTRSATPRDVEASIALPIEEGLSTVGDIENLQTFVRSAEAGFLIQFREETDMDAAYARVRDRLDRAMAALPEEVGRPFIWKYNPNNDPVYWVGAALPASLPPAAARVALEDRLVRRLERIPGVSQVKLEGAPTREIHVEIQGSRANAAGLGTWALVERLRRDNFSLSAGAIADGPGRSPLRVVARYADLEEIEARPVAPGVRLGDVATVRPRLQGAEDIYRVNGRPGVVVEIYKESAANTVEVCAAVRALIHSRDPELQDFEFIDFFDRGSHIEGSLKNLQETALWGGAFAALVLFVFLRRVRVTLLVTLSIPLSLLVTLVVMYLTGSSLNALSLMGLMLSVGMVVDNSIVVVESIQQARRGGLGAREAAVAGSGAVALAIVVATATTVVVFLPLILMSGSRTLSFYLGQIGYPVCVALVASLGVSLALIPLTSTLPLAGADREPPRLRALERLEARFGRALDLTLRRRADAAVVAALLCVSALHPMGNLKETEAGVGNPNDFQLRAEFAPSMTWEERKLWVSDAEAALASRAEALGLSDALIRLPKDSGRARLRVFLKPPGERPEGMERHEIAEAAQAALPQRPGVEVSARWAQDDGEGDRVEVHLSGPDSDRLAQVGEEVAARLRTIPGVRSAGPKDEEEVVSELQLRVQRDAAARQGLSPQLVGGSVDFALRGRRLRDLHEAHGQTPIVALAPEEDREDLGDLERVTLPSPEGGPGVALPTLTRRSVAPSWPSVQRLNRRTTLTLEVEAEGEDLKALEEQIDAALKGYGFPRGYSLSKGERLQRLKTNNDERSFALGLAVVCVFLLMGVLFESFVLPLSILASIPFAFVGVYWTLYLTDTSFDVMAGVGMVILVGVVVNNAVVLVDQVGALRGEGLERRAALVEAGRRRLRPILMTALTTICGLIPMATGSASLVGIPYAPLGRTLIGGMVASTVLTLFLVPLCYTLFDDLRAGAWALVTGRRPRGEDG